jgi:predicted amidohydrolase
MSLQVVVGQLEIGWDPAWNSERVISFLRAETRPGSLAVLPEAALSGYDDEAETQRFVLAANVASPDQH